MEIRLANSSPFLVNSMRRAVVAPWLFWLSVFLIPFDNFKFAPSMGWAAISPYLFLLFFLLNLFVSSGNGRVVGVLGKYKIIGSYVVISSIISYMIFGVSFGPIFNNFVKLMLGISFLLSLLIVSDRGVEWLDRALKVLVVAYFIAFGVGVLQFLDSKIGLGLSPLWNAVLARSYPGKVQFTFTEPSFVSVHIYGVLLPICYIRGKYDDLCKTALLVGGGIVGLSIFSGSSLQTLLISCLIAGLVSIFFKKSRFKIWVFVLIGAAVLILFTPQYLIDRVQNVLGQTNSVDPSAVARKLRVDSALYGWKESVYGMFFGFGFGNAAVAMMDGINEAFSNVAIIFDELLDMANNPDGIIYSMHIKILVEHGIIGYVLIMWYLFEKKEIFLWLVMMVIYLQFDSFAFYGIWIYLFKIICVNRRKWREA